MPSKGGKIMKSKYPKIGRIMRERAGYTQVFLATLLDNRYSVSSIRNYENGDRDAPVSYLLELSNIYQCTLSDLFDEEKNMVILPKLFRRLVSYLEINQELEGFKNSLVKSEKVLILPSQTKKIFRDIIIQEDTIFKLSELPENLVYL